MGERVSGYRVQRISQLDDLEVRCIELEHEKTGAQHLHIEADDANNLFRRETRRARRRPRLTRASAAGCAA